MNLPGLGDYIGRAWVVYKSKFPSLLGLLLVSVGLLAAVVLLGGLPLIMAAKGLGSGMLVPGVGLPVLVLGMGYLFGALIFLISNSEAGLSTALGEARRRLFSYLPGMLLLGLINLGVAAAVLEPIFPLILISPILIIPWTLIAIVVMLFLYPYTMLSPLVLVLENNTAGQALEATARFLKGRYVGVLWRIAAFTILSALIGAIPVLGQLVSFFVLTPMQVIVNFLIYQDLKAMQGEADPAARPLLSRVYVGVSVVGLAAIPILYFYAARNTDVAKILSSISKTASTIPAGPGSLAPSPAPPVVLAPPAAPKAVESPQYQARQASKQSSTSISPRRNAKRTSWADIKEACSNELQMLCRRAKAQDKAVKCLKSRRAELTARCDKALGR